MSSVTTAIKDTILPSDSNKETDVAAPEVPEVPEVPEEVPEVPETTPTVADPALVGRSADENVTEHTTVYTNATPDVLESADHQVMTEAVPITHTPVPDYNETPRAAPAITGSDLYSILGQSQPVSSTESQPVTEQPSLQRDAVSNVYSSEIPSGEQAWTVGNTDAYTSMGAGAATGDAAKNVASSTEAPTAPAGQGSVEDQFEPTSEQAWSVRGPASNLVSKGPHEHASHLNSDAAGNVAVEDNGALKADDLAAAPGAATSQGQSAVSGAAQAPGQAKDTVTGTAADAKDAVTGKASQATDAAKNTAEKPKKMGLVQKVKKALKIGKKNK